MCTNDMEHGAVGMNAGGEKCKNIWKNKLGQAKRKYSIICKTFVFTFEEFFISKDNWFSINADVIFSILLNFFQLFSFAGDTTVSKVTQLAFLFY